MTIPTKQLDALDPTINPQRDHEVAAMRDGFSNKLRVEQILALLQSSDIPGAAVTLAKLAADARAASGHTFDDTIAELGETDVQGAIEALATPARVDVASAATTNIGAAQSLDIRITGTTTITAFDTVAEGIRRTALFDDALTLTHNATSLILPGGDDITTAAGDVAMFRSEGSGNWRMIFYSKADGTPLVGVGVDEILHVRDEKSQGTNGGTFTSAEWRTRDLNTVVSNEIDGASLSSNRITLPAGVYEITASAPAYRVNEHRVRLRNITASTTIRIGTTDRIDSSGAFAITRSQIISVFTLGTASDIEIQHLCAVSRSDDGFGRASNLGGPEVYTEVFIRRVGDA